MKIREKWRKLSRDPKRKRVSKPKDFGVLRDKLHNGHSTKLEIRMALREDVG